MRTRFIHLDFSSKYRNLVKKASMGGIIRFQPQILRLEGWTLWRYTHSFSRKSRFPGDSMCRSSNM